MLAGGHPHWGQPDAERAAPWLPSLLCHPSDRRQPKPGGWPALAVRVPGAVRCGAEPVRWAAGTTRAPTPPWPGGPKSGRRRPGAQRSPKTNPRYRQSCAAHRSAHPARGAYQDRWLAWARRAPRALDPVRLNSATRRYIAFLCCDLAALSPAAAARLYVSSVLPLKISNRRRQSEPAALLRLADQSPTVIFRCGQSSRLLTIAAAVTSSKPRISGLTAAPFSAQVALAYIRSVMSV